MHQIASGAYRAAKFSFRRIGTLSIAHVRLADPSCKTVGWCVDSRLTSCQSVVPQGFTQCCFVLMLEQMCHRRAARLTFLSKPSNFLCLASLLFDLLLRLDMTSWCPSASEHCTASSFMNRSRWTSHLLFLLLLLAILRWHGCLSGPEGVRTTTALLRQSLLEVDDYAMQLL